MREKEVKFDEYNRPKGERSKEESKKTRKKREVCLMNTTDLNIKSNNNKTTK